MTQFDAVEAVSVEERLKRLEDDYAVLKAEHQEAVRVVKEVKKTVKMLEKAHIKRLSGELVYQVVNVVASAEEELVRSAFKGKLNLFEEFSFDEVDRVISDEAELKAFKESDDYINIKQLKESSALESLMKQLEY